MIRFVVVTVVVFAAIGAWAFEPWRLWTHSTIDEPLPTVAGAPAVEVPAGVPTDVSTEVPVDALTTAPPRRTPAPASPSPSPSPAEPAVVELATGSFVDAEHGTSGRVRVIELADGSRYVRLEDLDSSDGPDLYVGLSDAPSGGDWGSYDDGRYVSLGRLKATNGNQNYPVPADLDLAGLQTVLIWCNRFNVAFGTADVGL